MSKDEKEEVDEIIKELDKSIKDAMNKKPKFKGGILLTREEQKLKDLEDRVKKIEEKLKEGGK